MHVSVCAQVMRCTNRMPLLRLCTYMHASVCRLCGVPIECQCQYYVCICIVVHRLCGVPIECHCWDYVPICMSLCVHRLCGVPIESDVEIMYLYVCISVCAQVMRCTFRCWCWYYVCISVCAQAMRCTTCCTCPPLARTPPTSSRDSSPKSGIYHFWYN
jgi:hypothetical protein